MAAVKIRPEELSRSEDTTAVLVLLAAFLACTSLFFGVLQLDLDIGRDFVLADLLRQGKILYHDVRSLFGPLAPWFHLLLFRLFGTSVTVLLLAGATAGLGIVLLSYAIARQVLPPVPATVAGLIVTIHSIYGGDQFIYATPYTFAATYALLFSLLALYAALRTLDPPSLSRWDCIAGGAAALALVSKQEFALISAVTVAAALVLRFYRSPRRMLAAGAMSAACYALVATPFAFVLFRQVSLAEFLDNVYPKDSFPAWRHFYEIVGGWGPYFWPKVREATEGFLHNFGFVIWATCFIVVLADLARGRRPSAKLFWGLLVVGLPFVWRFPYLWYYPVFLHVAVLTFAVAGRAPGSRQKVGLLAFSAAVFLFRILPLARSYGYGQSYFIPSLIVYFYLCFELVVPRLGRLGPPRRLQAAMIGVFVACFVIPDFLAKELLWARRSELIQTERGAVRVEGQEAAKARAVLNEIRRYSVPQDKILMLPYGVMYCFLSDRQPPSSYLDYTNGQLVDGAPEQAEIGRLSQAPPKLVVIDDYPDEKQFAGPVNTFGRAYSVQFARWIHGNYKEVRSISYEGRLVHFLIADAGPAAAVQAPGDHGRR